MLDDRPAGCAMVDVVPPALAVSDRDRYLSRMGSPPARQTRQGQRRGHGVHAPGCRPVRSRAAGAWTAGRLLTAGAESVHVLTAGADRRSGADLSRSSTRSVPVIRSAVGFPGLVVGCAHTGRPARPRLDHLVLAVTGRRRGRRHHVHAAPPPPWLHELPGDGGNRTLMIRLIAAALGTPPIARSASSTGTGPTASWSALRTRGGGAPALAAPHARRRLR
jgi:hypothetical protein